MMTLWGDAWIGSPKRPRCDFRREGVGSHLGAVGNNIAKQASEFDPRNYGFSKLGELAAAIKLFDVDKRVQSDGHFRTIYMRDKRKSPRNKLLTFIRLDENRSYSEF